MSILDIIWALILGGDPDTGDDGTGKSAS